MQTMIDVHAAICKYIGKSNEIDSLTLKKIIAKHCGIDMFDFMSLNRRREKILPRYIYMQIMYKYSPMTYKQIGRELGGRDHSTVIHGITQLKNLMNYDYERQIFTDIMEELKSKFTLKTHYKK